MIWCWKIVGLKLVCLFSIPVVLVLNVFVVTIIVSRFLTITSKKYRLLLLKSINMVKVKAAKITVYVALVALLRC